MPPYIQKQPYIYFNYVILRSALTYLTETCIIFDWRLINKRKNSLFLIITLVLILKHPDPLLDTHVTYFSAFWPWPTFNDLLISWNFFIGSHLLAGFWDCPGVKAGIHGTRLKISCTVPGFSRPGEERWQKHPRKHGNRGNLSVFMHMRGGLDFGFVM